MWKLKYDTNELIYARETDSQTAADLWSQRGEEARLGNLGRLTLSLYDSYIERMDKQGPIIQHKEPYSISCNKP